MVFGEEQTVQQECHGTDGDGSGRLAREEAGKIRRDLCCDIAGQQAQRAWRLKSPSLESQPLHYQLRDFKEDIYIS